MSRIELDIHWPGPNTAPRVIVFTEHINATYYLSFHYAMEELVREGRASFAALSSVSVASALRGGGAADVDEFVAALVEETHPDVVVFSRYAVPQGPSLAEAFSRVGIPLVYHIDDDLLHLPESLGGVVLRNHGSGEVLSARRRLMERADVIYASTSFLAQRLRQEFPGRLVFSGIYAPVLTEPPRAVSSATGDTFDIGYMGSKGHARDLEMVEQALAAILRKHPRVRFEVFGTISLPESLQAFGERVSASRVIRDYREFLTEMSRKRWDVGIAPLRSDVFNKCKAPTKFIEYTSCGIPTVASDIEVYRSVIEDGVTGRLARDSDWERILDEVVADPENAVAWRERAGIDCRRRFSLDVLKRQLLHVVDLARRIRSPVA